MIVHINRKFRIFSIKLRFKPTEINVTVKHLHTNVVSKVHCTFRFITVCAEFVLQLGRNPEDRGSSPSPKETSLFSFIKDHKKDICIFDDVIINCAQMQF